ncbi:hypothetical protein H0O02_05460 [Candidatus Micrarchaeota archaeon]|nr:hypothetical protein [Candidatus Micrarchaeota archaeon]
MRKLVLIALLLVFIFGCIDGQPKPPDEHGNETGNKTNITVIIDEEKNESVAVNVTEEEEGNETEVWQGISYANETDANLGVYFFDVCDYGTGEHAAAIFLKKGDLDILIDAGSVASGGRVVDELKRRNIDDIDVLVSTAADQRRYGGLSRVLDEFQVEEFWWGGDDFSDSAYEAVITKATARAKNVRVAERGYDVLLNGIDVEVLNPKTSNRFGDVNNDAIVLRMEDRNLTLLLMGNIQTGAQGDLVNNFGDEIKVKVIEAPYYGVGGGTAMIALFLQASKPQYAVIEGCSDETQEVEGSTRSPFRRLMEQDQYRIGYLETYKNGTIKITVDNLGYDIRPVE